MSDMLTLKDGREPIAIIGIGCRFPGEANDPESFWRLLTSGVDAITEIPEDRWNIGEYYHPQPGMSGKTYSRWGGFIDGIDQFDPEAFGISPREAFHIDPQQRVLLEVTWEALQNGGQVIERLAGTDTGVFIGVSTSDYAQIQSSLSSKEPVDAHTATGGAPSIVANRISYCLNFRGPSLVVDTACSSSLVATHLACWSIWNRQCSLALAGGVNIIIKPDHSIAFSAASMLSPDGRCKAFDASANGFVRSEGAGIVVLKPLSKAIAERDPIYAVVVGSAVNQDGRTNGIAMPSQSAQEELIRETCKQAGIAPGDVEYVEAHGTGTAVGDPIEAMAIGNVLSSGRPKGNYCLIGSVKTNIGHLEAAAGIAGVIKAVLSLKHRMIPPNLHFNRPNPVIPFNDLQLRVPIRLDSLPDDSKLAIAGVNSFGFGGTNAHLLIKEYRHNTQDVAAPSKQGTRQPLILPLSAHTPEALQSLVQSYRGFIKTNGQQDGISLNDLCWTASVRRTHHEHRLSLVVHESEEIAERLDAFLAGERRPGMFTGRRMPGRVPKIAFVFSGQGPQWWAMGRELLEHEPVFQTTIRKCDELLRKHADWSLWQELTAAEDKSRLHVTSIAQPALFALQVALAALWRSWGIEPEAVVGHSVGEVAAAHTAGALSLQDAVRVIFHRGRCMDLASSNGKMLAVGLSSVEAEAALRGYSDLVSLAVINSPSSVTLSGDAEALEEISRRLEQKGVFCRFLRVNYAFHSPQMDPIKHDLLESLNGIESQSALRSIVSTVTGREIDGANFDKNYWWQNVRERVRFADAADWLIERDYDIFLELSPHPVLSGSISECLLQRGRKGTVLPSLRRQEEERAVMLGSLGAMHTLGCRVDWEKLFPVSGRCVSLPGYPWQRQSFWHEVRDSRELRLGGSRHPLLQRKLPSANPSWETAFDKRVLGYFEDHRVQDKAVVPATIYVEMALAAARETFAVESCILEEINFQKFLFLADNDRTPRVQFIFQPADGSFAIYSRASDSDQSWNTHAMGYMRSEQQPPSRPKVNLQAIRDNLADAISPDACYSAFAEIGLQYGPSFRGIERIWRKDGAALGEIRLREHLEPESKSYFFHPAFVDSCFQVLSGAIPLNGGEIAKNLYVPVQIERVRFYGHRPGHRGWSHVVLKDISSKALEGDVRVYNDEGSVLVEIEGLKCQAVEGMRYADNIENWFYETQWHHKQLPERPLARRRPDYIPSPHEIARSAEMEVRPLVDQLGWSGLLSRIKEPFDSLSIAYIVRALRELGWRFLIGERVDVDSLGENLKIASRHQRLFQRFLRILEVAGYLKRAGDEWLVTQVPAADDPRTIWAETLSRYPAFFSELSLIRKCGLHLGSVLRGEIDPLQVLFPEGSTAAVDPLYQDSPDFRLYNLLVEKVVSQALISLPEGRTVRILEVGAGTGGMTSYILPRLPRHRTEYTFSDVSSLFINKAEQKFHDYPFISFQFLDIEKDALQQGYEANSFDVILASNVLHTTRDLRESLSNILKLLSSEGLLIILEVERASAWVDLVFGLTEGWWRFCDFDLRPDYPLITSEKWKHVLANVGFAKIDAASLPALGEESSQVVILARGPDVEAHQQNIPNETPFQPTDRKRGTWLVFADGGGAAERLVELLRLRGEPCILVTAGEGFHRTEKNRFQISPESSEDMERLLRCVADFCPTDWCGTIHMWNLDISPPKDGAISDLQRAERLGCYSVLHYLQAFNKLDQRDSKPSLILVTRAAQPVANGIGSSIHQSPLLGLGRVIMNEFPNLRCKMVDLDDDSSPDEVESVLAELWTEDPDEEVVLRQGERFVPRLERTTPQKFSGQCLATGEKSLFRLVVSPSGVLDHLALRETKRDTPGPGQVEIEIYAASLNFRDVMKALGLAPTDGKDYMMLGDECAGKIVAVGDGVKDLKVGDEVVGLAPGSFASHATTLAELVMHKPSHLTFEEAVGMPVVFLTGHYGLHHLARIKPGDRILIHSATGGVGLAAVQIARHAGAEIFATAGSPEKREFLKSLGIQHIMDSRSLSFADQVMEITGGRGVDIVLNALAGKAIAKGLSCLAPYGRFVELGKRDIYTNSKLGLWAFRKNLSFFALDLGGFISEKPAVMRSLFAELSRLVEDKTFSPLPYRVFPASRIVEAFRHMAQATHIGKIVISMRDQVESIEPLEPDTIAFNPDGTYLISGGFGGFGLALAGWIVEHGGRNLVLMGRSGAGSEEATKALEDLQNRGVRVLVAKADVSKPDEVANVMAEISRTMPALKGIFHTAMVLDDGILLQLNRERFRKVMAPKMDGAWNLHYQSLNCDLDFFVLVSSGSALIGNPGQGNYAAANSFLDAFAHYRRSLGLPAVAINWGHLAGVGYVARHPEISDFLTRIGIEGISPKQTMDALGIILRRKPIQTGVMRMDWRKISKSISTKRLAQRFSSLIDESKVDEHGTEERSRMKQRLQEVKPEARQDIVETFIREQVARVLGTSATKLDPDRSLNELGLDSLMAVELKNRIESDLELSLPTGQLMQGPSIRKISTVVLDQLAISAPSAIVPPIPRQESPQELLAQVDRLSDEEVDSLLRKMVGEESQQTETEMRG